MINKFLAQGFSYIDTFFDKLEPFVQGFWENKRLVQDFDRGQHSSIAHEHLKNPLEVIPLVLQRFNDQKVDIENMIPPFRDLSLLRMNL